VPQKLDRFQREKREQNKKRKAGHPEKGAKEEEELFSMQTLQVVPGRYAERLMKCIRYSIDIVWPGFFNFNSLFYSIRFDSIRFDSIRFYSILFCSVLFCSVLFCSVLFSSVLVVLFILNARLLI
jgi:hypothetical protein